ncbi:hypothetical protein BKH43_06340 [Helicobacter sp. 13S00401-1]|uniref:sel1 repeat family protein n=1 Tax=Helicobacter sp. 13S00401-1 TaxID=1905758 RepID=UPI000BC6EB75|nr:sel1 repeat family protein [Helicobacter sp. 13S00401-1]PAF49705.1 hypothetical protein BKH43_06340 [Helicobacter sp. 13S00401-1]
MKTTLFCALSLCSILSLSSLSANGFDNGNLNYNSPSTRATLDPRSPNYDPRLDPRVNSSMNPYYQSAPVQPNYNNGYDPSYNAGAQNYNQVMRNMPNRQGSMNQGVMQGRVIQRDINPNATNQDARNPNRSPQNVPLNQGYNPQNAQQMQPRINPNYDARGYQDPNYQNPNYQDNQRYGSSDYYDDAPNYNDPNYDPGVYRNGQYYDRYDPRLYEDRIYTPAPRVYYVRPAERPVTPNTYYSPVAPSQDIPSQSLDPNYPDPNSGWYDDPRSSLSPRLESAQKGFQNVLKAGSGDVYLSSDSSALPQAMVYKVADSGIDLAPRIPPMPQSPGAVNVLPPHSNLANSNLEGPQGTNNFSSLLPPTEDALANPLSASAALNAAIKAAREGDYKKALDLFNTSCNQGNPAACFGIGVMFMYGAGVPQDRSKATRYYQMGCSGGDPTACTNLGMLYDEEAKQPGNPRKAAEMYMTGCQGGDVESCNNLAWAYSNGVGVPKNYQMALQYYKFACDNGSDIGCYNLGLLTNTNSIYGPNKATMTPLEQNVAACNAGDVEGCANLGWMYTVGTHGVSKNYRLASQYLNTACIGGVGSACNNLGVLYEKGQGVTQNKAQALELYSLACDRGVANGCRNYAILNNKKDEKKSRFRF